MNYKKLTAFITTIVTSFCMIACTPGLPSINPVPDNPGHASITNSVDTPDNPDNSDNNDNPDTADNAGESDLPQYAEHNHPTVTHDANYIEYTESEVLEATNAYYDYLCSVSDTEYANDDYRTADKLRFELISLSNDNVPELAYTYCSAHADGVEIVTYDFDTKEIVKLGGYGENGGITYIEEQNIVVNYWMGMGYEIIDYITFNDKYEATTIKTFTNNQFAVEYADEATWEIDGQIVDVVTYENELDKIRNQYEASKKYIYYERMLSCFAGSPLVDGPEWPLLSKQYSFTAEELDAALVAYTDVIQNSNCIKYSFEFIDNDNLPELIMVDETQYQYYTGYTLSIYSYDTLNSKATEVGSFLGSGLNFFEGHNLILDRYEEVDSYTDVYSILNGTPVLEVSLCTDLSSTHYYVNGYAVNGGFYANIENSFYFADSFKYLSFSDMTEDKTEDTIRNEFDAK